MVIDDVKADVRPTTAEEQWQTLNHDWMRYFGKPVEIRTDPEGAYRSEALQRRAGHFTIQWDLAPSQAHWQSGKVERHIGLIKTTMNKLAVEGSSIMAEELLDFLTTAHNKLYREAGNKQYEGWSPDYSRYSRRLSENLRWRQRHLAG